MGPEQKGQRALLPEQQDLRPTNLLSEKTDAGEYLLEDEHSLQRLELASTTIALQRLHDRLAALDNNTYSQATDIVSQHLDALTICDAFATFVQLGEKLGHEPTVQVSIYPYIPATFRSNMKGRVYRFGVTDIPEEDLLRDMQFVIANYRHFNLHEVFSSDPKLHLEILLELPLDEKQFLQCAATRLCVQVGITKQGRMDHAHSSWMEIPKIRPENTETENLPSIKQRLIIFLSRFIRPDYYEEIQNRKTSISIPQIRDQFVDKLLSQIPPEIRKKLV